MSQTYHIADLANKLAQQRDEIERLEGENKKLLECCQLFVDDHYNHVDNTGLHDCHLCSVVGYIEDLTKEREAG